MAGQAIQAWQAARPGQPQLTGRRTGQRADLLFAFRARRVSTGYINHTVIPMLGRKHSLNVATAGGVVLYELLRKYRRMLERQASTRA